MKHYRSFTFTSPAYRIGSPGSHPRYAGPLLVGLPRWYLGRERRFGRVPEAA